MRVLKVFLISGPARVSDSRLTARRAAPKLLLRPAYRTRQTGAVETRDQLMKSGQVKWVLLGAAVLIVALFLFAAAAAVTYQLFIAPERTHSRSNAGLRHDPN